MMVDKPNFVKFVEPNKKSFFQKYDCSLNLFYEKNLEPIMRNYTFNIICPELSYLQDLSTKFPL